MQAINTPTITKMETDNQATWIIGNYRIHVLPNHTMVVTRTTLYGNRMDVHAEECDSHAEAMELAGEWVEIATENETEWED
jgi:hypothetical protein